MLARHAMSTRTRLRLLVVAVLLVVLGAGAWLLARNAVARRQAELRRVTVELLPNVAQRIENFHRVKVDNGRKVWEVSAREAQYLEADGVVVVQSPQVSVFLKDGRTVTLQGRAGKVYLKERELQRVELEGEIEVGLGEYTMRTDHARYEADDDRIIAPGAVEISGDNLEIHGEQMEVSVTAQRLKLTRQIDMTLWPKT